MRSFAEYIYYLDRVLNAHKDLKKVLTSGSDRLLSEELNQLDYPCAFIEYPDVPIDENGNAVLVFDGSITILMNTRGDDWDEQIIAMDRAFRIAKDIFLRVLNDSHDSSIFSVEGKRSFMEPVTHTESNDNHGWRINLQIRSDNPPRCNDDVFNIIDTSIFPSFSYTNDNTTGIHLNLTGTSLQDGSYNSIWRFKIPDGALQTIAPPSGHDLALSNMADVNMIEVWLELSNGSDSCYAYACIERKTVIGESLPYWPKQPE